MVLERLSWCMTHKYMTESFKSYFTLNLETKFHEWQYIRLAVKNTSTHPSSPITHHRLSHVWHVRCILMLQEKKERKKNIQETAEALGQLWHLTMLCTSDPANYCSHYNFLNLMQNQCGTLKQNPKFYGFALISSAPFDENVLKKASFLSGKLV